MQKNMFLIIFLCCVFLSSSWRVHSAELYAGSPCGNPDPIPGGTCTLLTSCPPALRQVHDHHKHPFKRCGFDNFTEIVCCPEDSDHHLSESRNTKRKAVQACETFTEDPPISLTYHIVEGEDAKLGEFPHMVALGFYSPSEDRYLFDCGGTLISENFVLTAAHCIINVNNNSLHIIRVGIVDLPPSTEEIDKKIDHRVGKVTVHPNYNARKKINDIALVKLERNVSFNANVFPACLYVKEDDPEGILVTGWGVVEFGGNRSRILQKAELSPVPKVECNSTYVTRVNREVINSQLCAVDAKSDACQGDSGGPLQVQSFQNNKSFCSVVGIISYGMGCGSKHPSIYTRVYSYLEWIEGLVWP